MGIGPRPGGEASAAPPLETWFYHSGHLGSTSLVTYSDGSVVGQTIYKPFGEVVPATAGGPTDAPQFGYTSQRYEKAAGIYDYNARWYDPEMGRFLQPDSIVPSPFESQSLNRYAYVENDPVNMVDPTGNVMIPINIYSSWTMMKAPWHTRGSTLKQNERQRLKAQDARHAEATNIPSEAGTATTPAGGGDLQDGDESLGGDGVAGMVYDLLAMNIGRKQALTAISEAEAKAGRELSIEEKLEVISEYDAAVADRAF